MSLLIAACTVCVIILGFSINGTTVAQFETISYRSLIAITGNPQDIDLDAEYEFVQGSSDESAPKRLLSHRLVAMQNSYACHAICYSHLTIFAYVFKDIYLNKSKVDFGKMFTDSECLTSNSFNESYKVRS